MNSSMLVVYKAPLFGAELLIPENKAIHMLSIQAICYIVWSLKAENELYLKLSDRNVSASKWPVGILLNVQEI